MSENAKAEKYRPPEHQALNERTQDVEGLDVFCDNLAMRIRSGISVDGVDARTLMEVAGRIRALRTELEGWRSSAQAEKALREQRDRELDNATVALHDAEADLERKDAALREAANGLGVVPFLYSVIRSGEEVTEEVTDAMLKARDARVKVDRALSQQPEEVEGG